MEGALEATYAGLEGFNPVGWGAPNDDPRYNPRSAYISHRGAFQIADALAGSSLTSLDLSGQRVGDRGALALARALVATDATPPTTALKYLALGANEIGDDGAAALCDALCNAFSPLAALGLPMNAATDAAAVRLAATLLKLGAASAAAAVARVDLALNKIGQTGCYAVAAALAKLGRPGLVVVRGNPGHDGSRSVVPAPALDPFAAIPWIENERDVYEEATRDRNLRPIRSGGTSQTDSKTNLMNLRVATPFLSPRSREALSPRSRHDLRRGSESFLRTTSRRAAARAEREAYTATAAHRRSKARQMEETGRLKNVPDDRLPPLSFQKQARDANRFNRKARLARLAGKEKHDELAVVKAKLMKSISSARLRDAIAGNDDDSDAEREKRSGAKATRAVADVYKYFPNVLDHDGAAYGRIDLSDDGPRFGKKPKTPALQASARLRRPPPKDITTRSLLQPNHA